MTAETNTNRARRKFLAGITAAAAGVALTSGLRFIASSRADGVTDAARWGMLIDASKCMDCNACVTACNAEHGLADTGRPQTDAQWIRKLTVTDEQTGHVVSLPMLCQHCEHPPCVDVCPTGASFRRADGIVLVDKHTCIGCRYCVLACPYKARSFVHENLREQKPWSPRGKGTVEGCTMCVHRIDTGSAPACTEACNRDGNGAMTFGDLNDPSGVISRRLQQTPSQAVRADLGLNPGVRYAGLG